MRLVKNYKYEIGANYAIMDGNRHIFNLMLYAKIPRRRRCGTMYVNYRIDHDKSMPWSTGGPKEVLEMLEYLGLSIEDVRDDLIRLGWAVPE